MSLGVPELLIILVIVVVLFGPGRFGKILGDAGLFAKYADKLDQLQMLGDSPDAKAILLNLPGMQIETAKTIEIEFD